MGKTRLEITDLSAETAPEVLEQAKFVDENGAVVTANRVNEIQLPIICCDCGLSHRITIRLDRIVNACVEIDPEDILTDSIREVIHVGSRVGGVHDALKNPTILAAVVAAAKHRK